MKALVALVIALASFGLRVERRPSLAVRVHSLLAALAAVYLACYLGSNHLIGLRLWDY